MIPLVLAGAAAIFLTGCYAVFPSQREFLKDNLRRPKERAETEDGMAVQVYHELKSEGVSDSEMDRGCQTVDFDAPGPNTSRIGAGDGEIWSCEAYSHAIERYESYRGIVEGIAQGPVPWSLDDHDPSTAFDGDLRARIGEAKALVIEKLSLDPASAEFQDSLALALFFLTMFPKDAATIEANREYLLDFSRDLREKKLESFQEFLFERGGLGVLVWNVETEAERSALESYSLSKGKCTERSKLLFGVLREAGLNPFFVRSDYLQMKHQIRGRAAAPFYLEIPLFSRLKGSHMYVGVRLSGAKPRYLDPMFGFTRPTYLQYYPLDLTQSLAIDLSNRGVYYYQGSYQRKADSLIRQAFRLAPQDSMIGRNYDMILIEEGLRNFL